MLLQKHLDWRNSLGGRNEWRTKHQKIQDENRIKISTFNKFEKVLRLFADFESTFLSDENAPDEFNIDVGACENETRYFLQ